MNHRLKISLVFLVSLFYTISIQAQVGIFSKEDLLNYTHLWQGARYPDGRPKVSDEILERMKKVSIEEAWSVCNRHNYSNQFEGNWVLSRQNPVLTGRAVTAFFIPQRPDVNDVINETGKKAGRIGGQNSWIIDTIVEGDVIVVDLMGKVVDGTFLGDNLANSIWVKSGGTGVVIDGGARDIEGVLEIPDFPIFNRG
jgi:regulator of RNase E activity RraA